MQLLRSLLFNAAMYVWMPVVGLVFLPAMLVSDRWARRAMNLYARTTIRMLGTICGLRVETRGRVPNEGLLVASKHQSFLDVLALWTMAPRGFFIMKSILAWAPVLGQYALRVGCIPVQRGRRGEAIRQMLDEIRTGRRADGQLLIYPQGTRVAPGATLPYKVGTFAMYEQLGQPCIPVATNVGLFWPKRGVLRRPGVAVMEVLEPIPPGLDRATFMAVLESRIEGASNRLMVEAGFPAERLPTPSAAGEAPGLPHHAKT